MCGNRKLSPRHLIRIRPERMQRAANRKARVKLKLPRKALSAV
jgi:hypothetical protein